MVTANGDSSHEIRRHFLLGRKAMTNLDRVLKSRDITLLTKVCILKAMVFPVVTSSCERRQNTKELMLLNFGAGEDSWSPLTVRRSNQSILKEINTEYSLEGLMLKLKLQYFGHLMGSTNSLKETLMLEKTEGRRRRGQEDEMVGWHHRLNGHEFEQAPRDGERQGRKPDILHSLCLDHKELDMT